MKILELFSGTGSVGKIAKEKGWEVVSVDIRTYHDQEPPTHLVDILKFDYKKYKNFDIIWASPPCTYFSALIKPWIGRQKGKKEINIYILKNYLIQILKKG